MPLHRLPHPDSEDTLLMLLFPVQSGSVISAPFCRPGDEQLKP